MCQLGKPLNVSRPEVGEVQTPAVGAYPPVVIAVDKREGRGLGNNGGTMDKPRAVSQFLRGCGAAKGDLSTFLISPELALHGDR